MTKQAVFKFKPLSKKQRKVFNWWAQNSPVNNRDGIIADGAIRSGKTMSMSLSFVVWAMNGFDSHKFAMCGKTIGSFRRNVLLDLKRMLFSRGYRIKEHRADNLLVVSLGSITNQFYIFGGKDERSQDLIQGVTLAGVFFDEVALMPESFVNQAMGRCSVSGSKFWFNCNPEGPKHWFKTSWIDLVDEKNLIYLHFTMNDNLSLTHDIKERYRRNFSGVFFNRYILGEWCVAEGAIYRLFTENVDKYLIDVPSDKNGLEAFCREIQFITIGVDFGGNRSLTTFVATGFTRGFKKMIVLADHHIDGVKGEIDVDVVNSHAIQFYKRVGDSFPGIRIERIFADSEAQYLINSMVKAFHGEGIPTQINDCAKRPIIERIRCANSLISQERLEVVRGCSLVINGLETAVWDARAQERGEDVRLDDFTSDIDIMDAFEYSYERSMVKLLGGAYAD